MFKGCRREDSAPHIYSVAQSAYRNLLTTRQDQSIVLLGKSGSGKTTNCQHLVQYLVSIAGSTGKIFSAEKWQAVYTILEAFGNSSTSMNTNASRFSHVVSLDFDQAGQVASASIQTMLLEKLRVSRRPEAESTFNVFYYMMAGADNSLRTELHFNHLAENSAFGILPQSKPEDKQRASQQFTKLQAAMKVLGISGEEQKALWLILGAVYHLGAAGATKAGRRQFARHEWAQKAAYLLGCTLEELSSSIFKHHAKGLQHSTSFRGGSDEASQGDSSGSKVTALECLEAMASGLYSEVFTLVISLINRLDILICYFIIVILLGVVFLKHSQCSFYRSCLLSSHYVFVFLFLTFILYPLLSFHIPYFNHLLSLLPCFLLILSCSTLCRVLIQLSTVYFNSNCPVSLFQLL
ncbi:unconventional myosin-XVIIIa-like [Morone saxatilis]|uniref:unconventional myosin-XVIIIa-like n=1 Tax=Morone saxatilis TaxID=34816 RepID=UPI0015E24A5C|nr:unconventional myosin-XVIIIa-like [Morone saxatilis]